MNDKSRLVQFVNENAAALCVALIIAFFAVLGIAIHWHAVHALTSGLGWTLLVLLCVGVVSNALRLSSSSYVAAWGAALVFLIPMWLVSSAAGCMNLGGDSAAEHQAKVEENKVARRIHAAEEKDVKAMVFITN